MPATKKFGSITQDEERALIASSESADWVSVGGIEQRRDYWKKWRKIH
jgi:hypothetical protein